MGVERITCATKYGTIIIEMVLVPAGPFLMGTRSEDIEAVLEANPPLHRDWVEKEVPQHTRILSGFLIGRVPVTQDLWDCFVDEESGALSRSASGVTGNHPASNFGFAAAERFCTWLSAAAHRKIRLPSEAEWEKGARGTDAREWPWGNVFDSSLCNTLEGGRGATTPVGSFPAGASPYGALDMAGNVEEWCADRYLPYPDGRVIRDNFGSANEYQIVRGGSWQAKAELARCARRHGPGAGGAIGMRLALDA
ncbi:MAG TPA: SUMF1/EgtB/PvdO family nonheme iron enzyme [Thermoanaerobaculia bacterium]|jgi:formylglycine-generating enzyme required for sulfatase activity|nr:SUMF1/EgtB/PvdO family nonheme iron enzyme [Thermoanaerobaculia bacterium]